MPTTIPQALTSSSPMLQTFGLDLNTILYFISQAFLLFLLILIISHILSRLLRPNPVKLNQQSVVLIIGACLGVGREICRQIAQLYHPTILVVDVRKDLFEGLAEDLIKSNATCQFFYCDLAEAESVERMLSNIKASRESIDLLIYNAGVLMPNKVKDGYKGNLKTAMNINFFSAVRVINDLMENVEKSEGKHIAVVASVASIIPGAKYLSAYFSSKHAIYAYINCLRLELKQTKSPVTVSLGCPYAINTTMMEGFKSRMDWLFPVMDQKYVGERLLKEFLLRKEVCFVGRRQAFMTRVLTFFPTFIIDWLTLVMDTAQFPHAKIRQGKKPSAKIKAE